MYGQTLNESPEDKAQRKTLDGKNPVEEEPRNILVISCGGTALGVANDASAARGYTPGVLKAESFRSYLAPRLGNRIQLTFHDFTKPGTGSPDFTSDEWIALVRFVYERRKLFDGIVLIIGTDFIELAHALSYLLAVSIPIVVTGAYWPTTSPAYDGYGNVYFAVLVASSEKSRDRGVLSVFNGTISSGYYVGKHHANRPGGIHAGDAGELGSVQDDIVKYRFHPTLPTGAEIRIPPQVMDLPKVDIIKGYPGSDSILFFAAVTHKRKPARGMVLESMGSGSWSNESAMKIKGYCKPRKFPLVICRGPNQGHVGDSYLYGFGDDCIRGGFLSSMQAWILLRLLLCNGSRYDKIKEVFELQSSG